VGVQTFWHLFYVLGNNALHIAKIWVMLSCCHMGEMNVFAMAVDSKVVRLHKSTEFKQALAHYN
jgi:hypothetical protein